MRERERERERERGAMESGREGTIEREVNSCSDIDLAVEVIEQSYPAEECSHYM